MAVFMSSALTSCMENNNDWSVDRNANGNRTWAPVELSIEKGDTYLKLYGFTAAQATGYVAQVSKVAFDIASEEDIKSYTFGRVASTDSVTLDNLEPKTTYYVRIKALCDGKEDSPWLDYRNKGEYTVKTTALEAASFLVKFTVPAAGESLPAYWHDGAVTLYRVDTGDKMVVDASNKNFDGEPFATRLKSGGKSSDANALKLSCSVKGTLTIYAFGGSSSKNSSLIVKQGENELLNVPSIPNSGDGKSFDVKVTKAGVLDILYPENSVNFYGFKFVMDDDETYVEDKVIEPEPGPGPGPESGFEGTYSFVGLTLDDITTDGTTSTESGYIGINSTGGVELKTNLKSQANIVLSYTNSSNKTGIVRLYPDFVSVNGKGALIKVDNLKVGQTVKVQFASKNATATNLTANSGCTLQGTASSTGVDDVVVATFVATASSISIKENVVGFNLYSIEVIK